jgi:alpha-galactosidase
MKITVIGAGSNSFGRGIVADLLSAAGHELGEVELCLVDTAPAALERMKALARRLNDEVGRGLRITGETDRRAALPGSDYVITAVSVRRMALWEQDFRVPAAHGVAHILGENGGPGAAFHALRSLHLMIPICADIEALCPHALLLNFTNPEARVLHAVSHLTGVRAIGLCHGVFTLELLAARLTGVPPEHLEVTSAGLNHAYCALSIKDRRDGTEHLSAVLRRVQEDEALEVPPLFREIARAFEVLSYPSDDHIGEYFAFGAEFHGGKWPYGIESRPVTGEAPTESLIDRYLRGEAPAERLLAPSGELAVPCIRALGQAEAVRLSAVNVLNHGGLISNLPRFAAVEVPAMVSRDGVQPLAVGPLPEAFAAALATQCHITALVTEAYHTRRRLPLLQALLLDPCLHSIRAARALMDDMLALQADYLPPLD